MNGHDIFEGNIFLITQLQQLHEVFLKSYWSIRDNTQSSWIVNPPIKSPCSRKTASVWEPPAKLRLAHRENRSYLQFLSAQGQILSMMTTFRDFWQLVERCGNVFQVRGPYAPEETCTAVKIWMPELQAEKTQGWSPQLINTSTNHS